MNAIIERFSRFRQPVSLLRAYTLSGTQPRILARLDPSSAMLSQIFGPPDRLPFGASFWVHETITIRSTLTQPKFIDVDTQWFAPKFYIGAWELVEEFGPPASATAEYPKPLDGSGFISSFNQQIRFSTHYIVRGLETGNRFVSQRLDVDNCNFVLVPRPPSISPLLPPGTQPGINRGLFKGDISDAEFDFVDRQVASRAKILGIYIKPGVRLDSVEHEMSTSLPVFINAPVATTPICLTAPDCDTEFDTFIRANNGGQPINGTPPPGLGGFYTTQAICNTRTGGPCGSAVFTCSNGDSRLYWGPVTN